MSLLESQTTSVTKEVKALIREYTEKDLQEAVLLKTNYQDFNFDEVEAGFLLHSAITSNRPIEVIQLLLDSDIEKKTILEKDDRGYLPIHYACFLIAPVEVIQLLLDSDSDKRTILQKDDYGQLPIHLACNKDAHVEMIRVFLDNDTTKESIFEKDDGGRLPIHCACLLNAYVEVIQLLLDRTLTRERSWRRTIMDSCPFIRLVQAMHLWR
jgi:ankyrin repeat protein